MENSTSPSFYRILCVGHKSTKEQIKKAYIDQIKFYHPDKNPDKLDWATEQTSRLNLAYAILMSDAKRKEYDKLLFEFELREKQVKQQAEQRKRDEELRKKREAEARKKHAEEAKKQPPKHNFTETPQKAPEDHSAEAGALLGLAGVALLLFILGSNNKKK